MSSHLVYPHLVYSSFTCQYLWYWQVQWRNISHFPLSGFSVSFCIMKRRLSVNNLSSENNLPTDAPVVIRTKLREVRTNVAIYSHALPRIHIIGGLKLVRIDCSSFPASSQWSSNQGHPVLHLSWGALLKVISECAGPPPTAPVFWHDPALWSLPIHAPLQLTSPSSPSPVVAEGIHEIGGGEGTH